MRNEDVGELTFILLGRFAGVGHERERGLGDEVSDRHFNRVNFVVVNPQAVDDGFVSKAADFEDELQGGLAVSVSEGVIGCCRGVPFFRKWLWDLRVRCRV